MIYWKLFLTFLEIGAVSFGGGYGMIAMIREAVLSNGWLSEEEFLSLVAVSESTPGPLAVNMATFVGSSQAGFLGSLSATVGVVLPAFFIILLIASLMKNLLRFRAVEAFLSGVRPAVNGMILATAVTMGLGVFLSFRSVADPVVPDVRGLMILGLLVTFHALFFRIRKRSPSPILMLLLSAGCGILFYHG